MAGHINETQDETLDFQRLFAVLLEVAMASHCWNGDRCAIAYIYSRMQTPVYRSNHQHFGHA